MSDKTTLVLGGGVGGLITALTLRKKAPKAHRIVLIERQPTHLFAPSLLWLMTGERKPEQIMRPLDRLRKKGIEVVHAAIEHVDPENRSCLAGGTSYSGDFMVISLGAELAPETIPGLAVAGHDFYTLDGAASLRNAFSGFTKGRIVVLTAAPAYKCPAAPYEAAMLLEYQCRKRKVRPDVQIDLYAAEPGPMGVAGPEVSAAVRQMVEAKGIHYHPAHQVTSVDAASKRLVFANGATAEFDLLAYVPPHRAPKVLRDSDLVGESGWLSVDRGTMETKFAGVYAIGDAVSLPLTMGKPLPKAGVFAHAQAEAVAHNIASILRGRSPTSRFDGHGDCFVETGDGKAGFGAGNFYAEPKPDVKLHKPSRKWHLAKIAFEKSWLMKL